MLFAIVLNTIDDLCAFFTWMVDWNVFLSKLSLRTFRWLISSSWSQTVASYNTTSVQLLCTYLMEYTVYWKYLHYSPLRAIHCILFFVIQLKTGMGTFWRVKLCNTVLTPIIILIVLRYVFSCFSVVLFSQSETSYGHPSSTQLPTLSRYSRNSGLYNKIKCKKTDMHILRCPSNLDLVSWRAQWVQSLIPAKQEIK